jgi:hypothetical protein
VPTILIAILLFNLMYLITEMVLLTFEVEYFTKYNITYISSVADLIGNIFLFMFIFFFTVIMILSSLLVSLAAPRIYSIFISFINWVRSKKGYAKISPGVSVWHKFFILKNNNQIGNEKEEYPLVVQMYYLDNPSQSLFGCLKFIPADDKQKRQFIIDDQGWTDFCTVFQEKTKIKVPISNVFFDAESKLVVKEINQVELDRIVSEVNKDEWK